MCQSLVSIEDFWEDYSSFMTLQIYTNSQIMHGLAAKRFRSIFIAVQTRGNYLIADGQNITLNGIRRETLFNIKSQMKQKLTVFFIDSLG